MVVTSLHKSDDKSNLFAKNLKELMEKNHTMSKDLADYLGVSKSAISNYLAGTSVPRSETQERIAKYFDVLIDDLVGSKSIIKTLRERKKKISEAPCVAPLFCDKLSDFPGVVYQWNNFLGDITFPFYACGNVECCAVRITSGDELKSANIFVDDVVFFEQYSKVENGQVAAVHFKKESKISICRVFFEGEKTVIERNGKKETYTKKEINKTVVILGKAVKVMSFKDINK